MITIAIGATGSGKTKLITQLMRREWKRGQKIYSNYPISYDEKHTDIFRWHSLAEIYDIKNGIIAIDEAQKLINARNWRDCPTSFIDKITQHRKHKVDVFGTTQDILQIDVELRRNIHVLYSCQSLFRFPANDRVKPILQITRYHRMQRKSVLNPDYVSWEKRGWARFMFISRFWTKTHYDTYADIGLNKYICRIYKRAHKWEAEIVSRDLNDRRGR